MRARACPVSAILTALQSSSFTASVSPSAPLPCLSRGTHHGPAPEPGSQWRVSVQCRSRHQLLDCVQRPRKQRAIRFPVNVWASAPPPVPCRLCPSVIILTGWPGAAAQAPRACRARTSCRRPSREAHGWRISYSSAAKRTRKAKMATPRVAQLAVRSGRRFASFQRQRAPADPPNCVFSAGTPRSRDSVNTGIRFRVRIRSKWSRRLTWVGHELLHVPGTGCPARRPL